MVLNLWLTEICVFLLQIEGTQVHIEGTLKTDEAHRPYKLVDQSPNWTFWIGDRIWATPKAYQLVKCKTKHVKET